MLNWGTFDDRVWILTPDGRNTLLTGDIGSGKSTIVDAITTLLLPAHRIAYNKAAGAETGALPALLRARPLQVRAERDHRRHAAGRAAERDQVRVILGVSQRGLGATVTLAQVFWIKTATAGPARPVLRHRRRAAVDRRALHRFRH